MPMLNQLRSILVTLAILTLPIATFSKSQSQQARVTNPSTVDEQTAAKLVKVKRVFIEAFGEDPISKQTQAMVVDALTKSHRFIVTEKKDNADAVLKGVALEKSSQELHASSEATNVATAGGGSQSSISGSGGRFSGSSNGWFNGQKAGVADSQASTETINDARLTVRLVASDGDVLWSTTQESKGAKYKGASADVADQVVKQLLRELEKFESQNQKK